MPKPPISSPWSWGIAALCFLAACASSQAESPPAAPPAPQVSVARVVARTVNDWQDFTGRLEAVHTVELRPRVSGTIDAVRFTEGTRVKKDQILFQIDARPFREDVNRLTAELARGESQLKLARTNLARAEKLLKSGATSANEYDQLSGGEAVASANVSAVRAALASARLNLAYTDVRSPIAGRASYALITEGNLVSNASLLTRVVSDDPIYAYFDMDEATFLRVARDRTSQATVQMGLSADDGYPNHGKLDFVDNQVDSRTGTIRARAVFDNREQRFTPGLFSRVRLLGQDRFEALLIDDKALMTDQNRKYVFVLDESGKAQRRDVQLGRIIDGLRVVHSGLTKDDKVIVQGIQKVFAPGMPVQAQEVAMLTPSENPPTRR